MVPLMMVTMMRTRTSIRLPKKRQRQRLITHPTTFPTGLAASQPQQQGCKTSTLSAEKEKLNIGSHPTIGAKACSIDCALVLRGFVVLGDHLLVWRGTSFRKTREMAQSLKAAMKVKKAMHPVRTDSFSGFSSTCPDKNVSILA